MKKFRSLHSTQILQSFLHSSAMPHVFVHRSIHHEKLYPLAMLKSPQNTSSSYPAICATLITCAGFNSQMATVIAFDVMTKVRNFESILEQQRCSSVFHVRKLSLCTDCFKFGFFFFSFRLLFFPFSSVSVGKTNIFDIIRNRISQQPRTLVSALPLGLSALCINVRSPSFGVIRETSSLKP